jgi:hypothetical protein
VAIDQTLLEKLIWQIRTRKAILADSIDEYNRLQEIMEVLDAWKEERQRYNVAKRFDQFVRNLDEGQTFNKRDVVEDLQISPGRAMFYINRYIECDKLEKWGRGFFRRPLNRTGMASLKVVTR